MRFARTMLVSVAAIALAAAGPLWRTLPPTPELPTPVQTGTLPVGGVRLWYACYGAGPAVILLHGGLANSDYWGHQVAALARRHRVVLIDSRGHGRSTRDDTPMSYRQMANDVVGVMEALHLPRAAIIGWSDGGIIGLELALHHADRITRLFAFGANADHSGLRPIANPAVWDAYIARAAREYAQLSPQPDQHATFLAQMRRLWASQPDIGAAALHSIATPTWIVLGDHDEAISRAQTDTLARGIPGARLVILPGVSHFAFLQDPRRFNVEALRFLDGE